MAVIHRTTLTPGKLELLAIWLPGRPWYLGTGGGPRLVKAGGFRLDDPEGEVGIEFMVVTDRGGERPVTYQVPMSYRAAPLAGADRALVGTAEHGVLGRRYVYDGVHDPVLVAQLFALLTGRAEPQAQGVTDTPDPSVTSQFTAAGYAGTAGSAQVGDGPHGTDLFLHPVGASEPLTLRVHRVLKPGPDGSSGAGPGVLGHVTGEWVLPDGSQGRGPYATAYRTPPTA
jgi:Maltokinase N-terminal cap domain